MSLILHCGSEAVDKNILPTLPVPPPMGARHAVRPFHEDVEIIREQIVRIGGTVNEEAYGVKFGPRWPRQFFGLIGVSFENLHLYDDYQLLIGVRGSYDQTLPRALAVGSQVFVCDNLAFSAEIQVVTKQTTNIDKRLPGLLAGAIERIPALAAHQDEKFEKYKNFELGVVEADAMIIELVRRGAINPSQVGLVLKEWDNPSHMEHGEHGMSLWRLHNAITEAIKPKSTERSGIPQTWGRTQIMTEFFDRVSA
jgi:hypothetical protein